MGGAVDSLDSREALETDQNKLKRWIIVSHVGFNKGRCWILQWDGAALDVWTDWEMRGCRAAL